MDRQHPLTVVDLMEDVAAGINTVQELIDAELARSPWFERSLRLEHACLAAARSRLDVQRMWGMGVDRDAVLQTLAVVLEVEARVKAIAAGQPFTPAGRSGGRRRR